VSARAAIESIAQISAACLGIIAAFHPLMTARMTHAAALAGMTLAAAAALFVFDPAVTAWFPSCPLFALTGWLCPLCGSLRALHALLHGNVEAAVQFNALTTAGVAAGLIAVAHDVVRPGREALTARLVALGFSPPALALATTFGVLRNLHLPRWFVP
jgi:hypothetical protein